MGSLPVHSVFALALALAFLAGGFLTMCLMDLGLYALLGHLYTVSHAMYVWGTEQPWVRCAWIALGLAFTFGTYVHFWGFKV